MTKQLINCLHCMFTARMAVRCLLEMFRMDLGKSPTIGAVQHVGKLISNKTVNGFTTIGPHEQEDDVSKLSMFKTTTLRFSCYKIIYLCVKYKKLKSNRGH